MLALGIAAWVCARNRIGPDALQPPIEPIPWAKHTLISIVVSITAVYAFIALQQATG